MTRRQSQEGISLGHARALSPYPPQSGGGALGVSGIQVDALQGFWVPAYNLRE
jgi:hypothetical protein